MKLTKIQMQFMRIRTCLVAAALAASNARRDAHEVRRVRMRKAALIPILVSALIGLAAPQASALPAHWSKAYVNDELLGDDLVVEWNVASSWNPYSMVGKSSDAQTLINGGLITREKRGAQDIIRLTVGYRLRRTTKTYTCWDCATSDAERLGNDIIFEEGHW